MSDLIIRHAQFDGHRTEVECSASTKWPEFGHFCFQSRTKISEFAVKRVEDIRFVPCVQKSRQDPGDLKVQKPSDLRHLPSGRNDLKGGQRKSTS